MTDEGWVVDPRPSPPELAEDYEAEPYRDPFLVPVLEKLDHASLKQLAALMGAWPIVPADG